MSQNYSKDSFDRFGDDLCRHVLSFLPFEDRFRYECISRQWHRLVFTTQSDLIIDDNLIDISNDKQMFETIVKKLSHITCVHNCFKVNELLISLLIKHCTQLTDIYINFDDISVKTIDKFFAKFAKQLKTIVFPAKSDTIGYVVYKWSKLCVDLQSIGHTFNFSRLSSHLIDGQNEMQFKRLKDIQLVVNEPTDDFIAFDLFANLYKNNIKTIELYLKCDINEDIVNRLSDGLSRMKSLIDLKISMKSGTLLAQLLSQIGLKCPQLKSLYISFYGSTVDHLFHTIGTSFKRLKRLEVTASLTAELNATTDSLNTLKGLTHLKIYRIEGPYFTDQFFVNISSHLPLIQHLTVDGVKITSAALEALLRLKHIRTGRLDGDIADPGTDLFAKFPVGFDLNGLMIEI